MDNDQSAKAASSKNTIRRLKIAGIIVILIAVVAGGTGLWIFVDSARAVNDYIGDVDQQYQDVTKNRNIDQPNATLRKVWLGGAINGKYKSAQSLDGDYQKLINSLRKYTITMDVHNQIVKKFNAGIEGNEVLNGDILTLANKMTDLVKANYPDKKEQIAALEALTQKISTSTKFSDISSDVNGVLHANDTWLNSERQSIESARQQFQNKINSI